MAQLWDKQPDAKRADAANPLPNPQLNPVMNPILGKNLGRWAQVYYTNPPEKREQAVAELLRELESQASEIKPHAGAGKPGEGAARHQVVCPQCQRKNDFQQDFCSFCGSRLHPNRAAVNPASPVAPAANQASARTAPGVSEKIVSEKIVAQPAVAENVAATSSLAHGVEPATQRSAAQTPASADQPADPARRRWVKLVAGALVILLVGVAYLYWKPARHAPAQLATQKASTANPQTSGLSAKPAQAASGPGPAESGSTELGSTEQRPGSDSPGQTINSSGHAPRVSTATPGTEDAAQDLLLAQRYLANVGAPGNSAEAAKWLWKAVGKHNTRAALLLADLYLKGEGVARSCDQARLLLQAAVARGDTAAGEKLRSLESDGCP